MDIDFQCPACGNDRVTLFQAQYRRPRTLQCGHCFTQFGYDLDTGEYWLIPDRNRRRRNDGWY